MTRRLEDKTRTRLAVLLALLHPGCTPAPPSASSTPSPPSPAATAPVPASETFSLTQVSLRYDEQSHHLLTSYTARNQGSSRMRAYLCVDLLDPEGYPVDRGHTLERISLLPGDSDRVEAAEALVPLTDWTATARVRVFVSEASCSAVAGHLRSEVLWLDKSGQPLPPGARPEVKRSEAEGDTFTGSPVQLREVRVTQNAQKALEVDYLATNLTQGRVSAQLCLRLLTEPRCACQSLDYGAAHQSLDLGRGASERRTDSLWLNDSQTWGKARHLIVYLARFGCNSSPEEASSNVVTLPGPAASPAPLPRAPSPRP